MMGHSCGHASHVGVQEPRGLAAEELPVVCAAVRVRVARVYFLPRVVGKIDGVVEAPCLLRPGRTVLPVVELAGGVLRK